MLGLAYPLAQNSFSLVIQKANRSDLLRCVLYTVFVGVMIRLHTFPLFSIRPLYLTVRAFHKAVNDVILSRRAIHAMNNLFPLATEQELTQGCTFSLISSSFKYRPASFRAKVPSCQGPRYK